MTAGAIQHTAGKAEGRLSCGAGTPEAEGFEKPEAEGFEIRKLRMSARLQAVAAMIRGRGVIADIGCDHAYIPIALVGTGQFDAGIAADVRPGPLQIAAENIRTYGLQERIRTRCSDGLAALVPGEADTVVIAGMGGPLICRILTQTPAVTGNLRELILEPQSDAEAVRRCLLETEFAGRRLALADEILIEEDGKFYPILRAVPADAEPGSGYTGVLERYRYRYGPVLLERRSPVLHRYLLQKRKQYAAVLAELQKQEASDRAAARCAELEEELRMTDAALNEYE